MRYCHHTHTLHYSHTPYTIHTHTHTHTHTEFAANATSMVGNFNGPCLIYLNGESITVKRMDRLEIAKWPYVMIRQFRAEENEGENQYIVIIIITLIN